MHAASSRHLTDDYEAYLGLSLRQLARLVLTVTPMTAVFFALLGLVVHQPVAMGALGLVMGFIASITICPKWAGRLAHGKPRHYFRKLARLLLARCQLTQSPYLHYQGYWHVFPKRRQDV